MQHVHWAFVTFAATLKLRVRLILTGAIKITAETICWITETVFSSMCTYLGGTENGYGRLIDTPRNRTIWTEVDRLLEGLQRCRGHITNCYGATEFVCMIRNQILKSPARLMQRFHYACVLFAPDVYLSVYVTGCHAYNRLKTLHVLPMDEQRSAFRSVIEYLYTKSATQDDVRTVFAKALSEPDRCPCFDSVHTWQDLRRCVYSTMDPAKPPWILMAEILESRPQLRVSPECMHAFNRPGKRKRDD